MWPLSRQATKTKAKVRRFSRPDGYLVYLGEAAGRERSRVHMARFSVPHESRSTRALCNPMGTQVYLVEAAGRERIPPNLKQENVLFLFFPTFAPKARSPGAPKCVSFCGPVAVCYNII